jgi:hypothetical protein
MRRATLTFLLLTLFTSALGGQALAAQPLERVKYSDADGPFRDDFLSDACGFDVYTEFTVKGVFTLFDDFSGKDHQNFEAIYSAGGKRLIERDGFTVFFTPETQSVEGSILTITFSETFKGLPLKWMQPGNGVLIRDAGRVTFDYTVVIDLDTGEEISFEQEVSDVKGPHPFLDLTQQELLDILCGALA